MTLQSEDKIWDLAYKGQLDQLKKKIQESPNLAESNSQEERRQPIHWACAGGHDDVVNYLLQVCKVSFDESDDAGWTPLLIASSAGHEQIVRELLRRGANPSKTNMNGQIALHYAASKNHFKIAELLIENGSELNVQDTNTSATPLHRAASKGNIRIVELLLQHKCLVNIQDIEKNTPLHLSCEEERTDIAELLVQHEASVTIENKEGKTPIDLSPPFLKRRLLGE